MSAQAALAWCPCPDSDSAKALVNALLDEKLIACANILSPMQSIFEWNCVRGEATEVGLLMKTSADLLADLCCRVEQLHPYDTPVVMGWKADAANAATLDWIGAMGQAMDGADG